MKDKLAYPGSATLDNYVLAYYVLCWIDENLRQGAKFPQKSHYILILCSVNWKFNFAGHVLETTLSIRPVHYLESTRCYMLVCIV